MLISIYLNQGQGRFQPYKRNTADLRKVYSYHYTGQVGNETELLNEVFRKFNIEHPADYQARSLSVGDIICLGNRFFAVEQIGFKEVQCFDELWQEVLDSSKWKPLTEDIRKSHCR
jgi:hypothetical protein